MNWHLYLGLLITPYVVIYALSAVALNHSIKGRRSEPVSAVVAVTIPEAEDDIARARAISEQVGMPGWLNKAKVRRPTAEELVFEIGRPGSRVTIQVDEAAGQAEVTTRRFGIVGVLTGLHGLRDLGGTFWGRTWAVFTEVSAWVLALALFSGTALWLPRPSARVLGASFLAAGTVGGLLLVAWIW